ncbi:PREDICTED: zinc finger BED domain-containing protein 1-like, partial [Vollenhovia emeryi]|uniref:zinc finger BED domain-containing protein 1-like n=1 Tax=Vollenhovia emeryi TaxID=411798 RepID=UPI0005F375F9
ESGFLQTTEKDNNIKTPHSRTRQTCLQFRAVDKRTHEKYSKAVAYFIATSMQPYSVVDSEGFQILLKTIAPNFKCPHRNAMRDKYIPMLYAQTKETITTIMKNATDISFTTDCWTSEAKNPYFSLTAHFITEDWKLMSACLNCSLLDVDHTALNLKDSLLNALEEWNISRSSVAAFSTDNGSNIVLAISLMSVPHIACFAHTTQIGVENLLKDDSITPALAKARKIQSTMFLSTKARRCFREIMQGSNKKAKMIPAATPTGWWSTLNLIEAVVSQDAGITQFLLTYNQGKYSELRLNAEEYDILKTVVRILKPIQEICLLMSSEQYVTASTILPLVNLIEESLENEKETDFPIDVDDVT